jgi:hypothetical protein
LVDFRILFVKAFVIFGFGRILYEDSRLKVQGLACLDHQSRVGGNQLTDLGINAGLALDEPEAVQSYVRIGGRRHGGIASH